MRSFGNRDTERLFNRERARSVPQNLQRIALRKLRMVHRARSLLDLRVPPGDRLEALRGNRKGQHGIRVNDQYRICFTWKAGGAYDVEILDYH